MEFWGHASLQNIVKNSKYNESGAKIAASKQDLTALLEYLDLFTK